MSLICQRQFTTQFKGGTAGTAHVFGRFPGRDCAGVNSLMEPKKTGFGGNFWKKDDQRFWNYSFLTFFDLVTAVFRLKFQVHSKINFGFCNPRAPVSPKESDASARNSVPQKLDVFFFHQSIKNWMGPYQWTPKEVARAIRYSGLGGPFSGSCWDFLEPREFQVVLP